MAKSIEIKPLNDGRFLLENSRGAMWNCNDADDIGTFIEAAIWPLIEPALKERKPITINIVIDGKIA